MNISNGPNCIDIVVPLITELRGRGLTDHLQLMGGIGSAVLKHPGTVIDPADELIIAPDDFLAGNADLATHRENGTLRDLDALVLSDDPAYISEIEEVTRKVIDGMLEVSVFGLRPMEYLDEQRAHPFGLKSLKTFVSDRYMDSSGSVVKGLTPFAVPVPKEAMESWTLQVGDHYFPVMNPGASLLNYETRSISGLRPKDFDKVQSMARQVSSKWPGVAEWVHDGPGKSQLELAQVLQTLRRASPWARHSRRLNIAGVMELEAGRIRELADHPAFMFREAPAVVQETTLALAVGKARLLGTTESNKLIVRLFQKFAEKRLDTITKNQ